MKVLILEDERLVADHLIQLVRKLEPNWEIAGPLASLREAKKWLQQYPLPDLILADIQLSDGISLELFSFLQPACPVIFTTAFDEYAIRAFKINSIDYLLKPVDPAELGAAFRKFNLLREKYRNSEYLKELMSFIGREKQPGSAYKENFAVQQGRAVYMIPVSKVAYFAKEELIYLAEGEGSNWITDFRSLDGVEELTDPGYFFRAN
ncbi:MAG TPA: LytTR family DNA-binding domain-containing protein, partial [Anseongella sp.]|nr:LytTR family DNA-binding domain-containing protein [Anseongella sp.]